MPIGVFIESMSDDQEKADEAASSREATNDQSRQNEHIERHSPPADLSPLPPHLDTQHTPPTDNAAAGHTGCPRPLVTTRSLDTSDSCCRVAHGR